MTNPHLRRVHLVGSTDSNAMTACGKIASGMKTTTDPARHPPEWYCPACLRWLANARALRAQLAAVRQIAAAAKPQQPTLFELRTDARPAGERTAAERYAAPSLFTHMEDNR